MKKLTLCLLLAGLASFLEAQSVMVDSTFGLNGQVATQLTDQYGNPYGQNIALLPNGAVVTIGVKADSSNLPTVEKFGNNGALDPGFTQTFPSFWYYNFGVSAQMDGKLLVTGAETAFPHYGLVARLDADGTIDTAFGIDGFSTLLADPFDNIVPMELSTGKILVFGDEDIPTAGIRVFATQLHSNGVTDTTFAEGGYFRFDLPDKYLLISAALEQPDGKILLAGMAHWDLFMIRLHPDGTLDLSYGTNGYLIDPMPNGGEAYDLALQPDGKIL
ncbi:MAG: hypothetical protein Q7T20_19310, partial [Saprospiraceae bacterium]|nr:hypothetical protein [Saprospiraceae bacterium]